ncbi:MAG TPA: hypothetical protein VGR73_10715 [Bryobacteraceae bacterium]|nr:hypothetical protein [Bryobacteraceae bacterium]
MRGIIHSVRAALRFRGYKPQPLSWLSARRWIKQFDKKDRVLAKQLLDNVIYLSEATTREILVGRNAVLMKRLNEAGLPAKNLIYVSVHEAGSSSPVMLNLLRDAAFLEKLGCRLIDGRDTLNLVKAMNELGEGALIYVDDFVGSGTQFCTERDFIANNFVGTFSEFMLAPSICEEAFEKLDERGIQAFAGHKHVKSERPLHPECPVFDESQRQRVAAICKGIDKFGLGYKGLATMVVLYRNAPNTVPVMLRGNVNQRPYFGIFPRTIDLPLPS